jgi:hypothetical protein
MLKSLGSRWSLVLILGKKLGDKIFGLIGHGVPNWVCEGKLTYFDLLHDLLVTSTIEWGNTRENDISYNSARPNVTLGTIVLG